MDADDCAIFDVARQHLFTKDGGLFTKGGMIGSLKMQNRLVLRQTVFCWMDWVSGCLTHHIRLILLPFPLRPAERSILFSEKNRALVRRRA